MLPDGWSQQWRVLRFIPTFSSSNLIQAQKSERIFGLKKESLVVVVVAVVVGGGGGGVVRTEINNCS